MDRVLLAVLQLVASPLVSTVLKHMHAHSIHLAHMRLNSRGLGRAQLVNTVISPTLPRPVRTTKTLECYPQIRRKNQKFSLAPALGYFGEEVFDDWGAFGQAV